MLKKYTLLLCILINGHSSPDNQQQNISIKDLPFLPKICDVSKPISDNEVNKINNHTVEIITMILNAYMAYYTLFTKLSSEDILQLCQYIHSTFPFLDIHEKALAVGIWKLAQGDNLNSIIELMNMLQESYPNSEYLSIGCVIISFFHLMNFTNDPSTHIIHVQNIINNFSLIDDNQMSYKAILLYIIHYYCSEYYLNLAYEYFLSNKFSEAITYTKRVLLRSHIHPRASLEAILILIEIFCILQDDLLKIKYMNILINIVEEYPDLENYLNRGKYIINSYKTNNQVEK